MKMEILYKVPRSFFSMAFSSLNVWKKSRLTPGETEALLFPAPAQVLLSRRVGCQGGNYSPDVCCCFVLLSQQPGDNAYFMWHQKRYSNCLLRHTQNEEKARDIDNLS